MTPNPLKDISPNDADGRQETKLKKARRAAFIKAASMVFLRKGYEATSIDEITTISGGSKATLYSYFENKEGLFRAVVFEEFRKLASSAFDIPDYTGDPATVLHDVGIRIMALVLNESSRAFQAMSKHEAQRFPQIGRSFYDSGPKIVNERLGEFLRHATENGDLVVPDVELAATQFNLLCQAQIVMEYQLHLIEKPSLEKISQIVSAAVTVFMAAYGPSRGSQGG